MGQMLIETRELTKDYSLGGQAEIGYWIGRFREAVDGAKA